MDSMIKKKNIILRAPEPQDIALLYRWENDTTLWYLSDTLVPFSHHILEQYIIQNNNDIYTDKQLRLMIEIVEDGKGITIGSVDLFDFDPAHRRAGIGILIDQSYRKQGYASDSLDLLVDYTFNTLNLKQLYCTILKDNKESHVLFQKKGFELIGVKKEWRLINGKWNDEYMYQLINPNHK